MLATAIEKYSLVGVCAPRVISSDAQNDRYTAVLLELERKPKLTFREKNYAKLLTLLIDDYEEREYPIRKASPVEVLSELMSANGLLQKDLASLLGSESVVSEILNGHRGLNKSHIEKLSKRFKVSPAVFF
jgi:HTH-type transcriptional regulator/antitoxin HigA